MTHPAPITYARAKRLRREMTEAERRLWYHLRAGRLNGFKFYRQVPLGPYIVDFINHQFGLVVEVDGATHGEDHEVAHDTRRTAFLEARGLRVLRAWNHDVFTNINGVCDTIVFALEELRDRKATSLPVAAQRAPSLQRREGR
jgi:very-short-patch-repair endonuclease